MASTSETGHLKNVTNFGRLITFAEGYGPRYAPSNPSILLTALADAKTKAEANLKDVKETETPHQNAVNARRTLFRPLGGLATRTIASFEASGADTPAIENARTVNRKIQGSRAPGNAKTTADSTNPQQDTISASQHSFDRQADYLEELITILSNDGNYNPNETDLTIDALTHYQAQLIEANKTVAIAYAPYSNAMIARDKTLYADKTGIIDLAQTVKSYIKSVFGANSPEFRQVDGIEFKSVPE